MSWEVIIPFLRPIEPLLKDPDISDILVHGSKNVFVERNGRMHRAEGVVVLEKALEVAVRNIARSLGDEVSEERPILDARLEDGSRVCAVLAKCSVDGTILAIRKFQNRKYTADELVRVGTLSGTVLEVLREAVRSRANILISGPTGSGKTTLLNVLAGLVDQEERLVLIEDTSEICVPHQNLVRLEARRANGELPEITIRHLVRATLRLRPDRILLGEVRGAEAFDLLQALNTGHNGTLATIHANSAAQAINRFTTCVLQSDFGVPYAALRSLIGDSLHLIVHIDRRQGRRQVREVLRLRRYDVLTDHYDLDSIYTRDPEKGEHT